MTEKLKESLSALVDDEADEFETRRVFDEMVRDQELRDKWHRYHMVRGVIRGSLASSEMLERFWRALDAQDDHDQKPVDIVVPKRDDALSVGPTDRKWVVRVTGLSIAAAVAVVVIFFYRNPVGSVTPTPVAVVVSPAQAPSMVPSERDLRRVQAYMQQHARNSSMANRARPVPVPKLASLGNGPVGPRTMEWQVGWIPDGFKIASAGTRRPGNIQNDVNTTMYSDGFLAFSVFVESMPETGASDWVSRDGTNVVVRVPIPVPNQKLVTVVGELSTPTATRIARSIYYRN